MVNVGEEVGLGGFTKGGGKKLKLEHEEAYMKKSTIFWCLAELWLFKLFCALTDFDKTKGSFDSYDINLNFAKGKNDFHLKEQKICQNE